MDEKSSTNDLKIIIGWLYPRHMSTYGDRGNILTIWQRCRWRGISVEVREINIGDRVDPSQIDFYFFGGGQDQAQRIIADDLEKTKRESLRKASRLGSFFLGICGGYQLLGNYYQTYEGDRLNGLGLLDVITKAGSDRMIGNVVVEITDGRLRGAGRYLVGFENHSGRTYLGKKAKSIGSVVVGFGNNGEDRTEGAFSENVFGCYLHGPLLPKNPKFTDFLIKKALSRKYDNFELSNLDDKLEISTQESIIERSKDSN